MSAFSVSDKHINTLVSYANHYCRGGSLYVSEVGQPVNVRSKAVLADLGQILRDANNASVYTRYDQAGESYTYRAVGIHQYSEADIIQLCRCYAYQSCEFNGWSSSEARRIVNAIERIAVDRLIDGKSELWAI